MEKMQFIKLFTRSTNNHDYLMGRVAANIPKLKDKVIENLNGNYEDAFYYSASELANVMLNLGYNAEYYSLIFNELLDYKESLFNLFNSDEDELNKSKIELCLDSYENFVDFCGYPQNSRILRRYKNLKIISEKYYAQKITYNYFRDEILSHIIFFYDMVVKISKCDDMLDLPFYLWAYDMRASKEVRILKKY